MSEYSTPLLQDIRSEEMPQVIEASPSWFPRSEIFHSSFTSEEEYLDFAKMFKQQRLRLNYSAKEVALEVRCSHTTIHCFESLKLSMWSMRKWTPRLQNWLFLATKSPKVKRLVPTRPSQSTAAPSGFRHWQPTKGSEVLQSYKGSWRPWRPWSTHAGLSTR